jgi:four helix bundle protein
MSSNLPYVQSYRSLTSYKYAIDLADRIFHVSLKFPKEETYSLTDQIRRSSRSIGAQIAEAWGKRRYVKHFVSKITDAYSETYETEHWLFMAYRCKYLNNEEFNRLSIICHQLSQLLGGMISKAYKFCD